MVNAYVNCVYSLESDESVDLTSLKNKTFSDESSPLTTPRLSTDKGGTGLDSDVDSEQTLFTDKMISGNSIPIKANDWRFFPF